MPTITSDTFRPIRNAAGDWLCIRCFQVGRIMEKLALKPGVLYDVEIKQHRERRSLDANAYFWVLADKLAEKLTANGAPVSKEDIYCRLIPDVPGASTMLCMQDKAVHDFCRIWESNGLGWKAETFESKIPGCTNVLAYKGSSQYDTHQMSLLLNMLITECKELGIETLTPEELARMEGYDAEA